jgi:WD40 repeat protein/tetratricopeptide (TPR) repeat protein
MSQISSLHPSPDELAAFARGEGGPAAQADIARHVAGCAACCQVLRGVPDDTLVLRLRQAAPPAAPGEGLPELPGYQIIDELGRGGMGVVYRAWQERLKRLVAVKMVLAGEYAGEKAVARLRVEAEAVARLQHPNIVQIHDVGEYQGRPYFTLEYVDGGSLANRLGGRPLPAGAAAELVEMLARAVHYAHQRGIVHRDLKPANVLLASGGRRLPDAGNAFAGSRPPPADLIPKISDFSLAKLLVGGGAGQTQTGDTLGTPSYMAPEQAGGGAKEVGPAADVYALGAILYECLTGRPPFQGTTALETLQQAVSQDPVPPRRLQPKLPRDLETVCLKCLHKEPGRRYASAVALAEDLRRFAAGEPVLARPVGGAERLGRWCRRNPALAALVASVAVLLVTVAAGASLAALAMRDQVLRTRQAEQEAQRRAYDAQLAQAQARWSDRAGRRFEVLRSLAGAAQLVPRLHLGSKDVLKLRNEAIACMALVDLRLDQKRGGYPAGSTLTGIAFDGPMERYARVDADGNITVRRLADDEQLVPLTDVGAPPAPPRPPDWRMSLVFSPDGRLLAASGRDTAPLQVWDLTGPKSLLKADAAGGFGPILHFSPDSRILAVRRQDESISLYDVRAAREIKRLPPPGQRILCLRFHPDGRQIAVGSGSQVHVLDLDGRRTIPPLPHPREIVALSWSGDGQVLATACNDGQAYVWDVAARQHRAVCKCGDEGVFHVALSPGGDLLATAGGDTTRLWDAWTGKELLTSNGLASDFSRDGRWLGLGVFGADVGRWEVAPAAECRLLYGHPSGRAVVSLDMSPDGRLLASASGDGVRLWDAATGRPVKTLPTGNTNAVLFDLRGRFLITSGPSGLYRWPVRSEPGAASDRLALGPAESLRFPTGYRPRLASLSADGRTLAACTDRGPAVVLDLEKPEQEPTLVYHPVSSLGLSPDGKWLATNTSEAYASKVWDARTGQWLKDFPGMRNATMAFSPDGRWLVFATAGEYLFHHVGSWQPGLRVPRDSAGYDLGPVAFSRDSRLVAIAQSPRAIRLIDPESGTEMATLAAPAAEKLRSLCFSPDGSRLAAGTNSGVIQLWDLRRIREQLRTMGLDWDPPAEPSRATDEPNPLQVDVDPGDLADREKYSIILAFCPFHAEAYYRRGLAEARIDQWQPAFKDFSVALTLKPDHAEAWYQRGLIHARQGRYPQAVADFSRAIALRPRHGDAYQQRAGASEALQQWDRAVADYGKALEAHPGAWELWYRRGFLEYWRLRRWPRAVADFAHGLDADPTAWQLWAYRGISQLELGQWQKALDDLSRAVELDNAQGWVWNARGIAHAALGRWDRAEADFARAADLDPASADLWYRQALTYLALGDGAGYRRACAAAVKHFDRPADASSALWLAWTCVLTADAVADPARPVQWAEKAAAGDPPSYPAARALGAALLRAGKLEAAIRELNRATTLQQAVPTTWLLLALAHHRSGHAGEARRWLEKAVGWIEKASQTRSADGDGLSDWDRIPLAERATLQILRGEAESLIAKKAERK